VKVWYGGTSGSAPILSLMISIAATAIFVTTVNKEFCRDV
jgi:hypothetical protein